MNFDPNKRYDVVDKKDGRITKVWGADLPGDLARKLANMVAGRRLSQVVTVVPHREGADLMWGPPHGPEALEADVANANLAGQMLGYFPSFDVNAAGEINVNAAEQTFAVPKDCVTVPVTDKVCSRGTQRCIAIHGPLDGTGWTGDPQEGLVLLAAKKKATEDES